MNEGLIICFSLIPAMLIFRLYYSGLIAFFQNTMSISIMILISLAMMFVYENSLSESINKNSLEKVSAGVFQDIDLHTRIHRRKNTPPLKEPIFKQDEEMKKENKNIVNKTLIVGLCSFFPLLFVLYYIDPHFIKNFMLNLLSVIILTIVQVFFTFSIRENYKDQDLEAIRHLLVCEVECIGLELCICRG